MKILGIDFAIRQEIMKDLFEDTLRFSLHIFMLHLFASIIEEDEKLFGIKLYKMLLFTALSLLTYHLVYRRIIYQDEFTKKNKNN